MTRPAVLYITSPDPSDVPRNLRAWLSQDAPAEVIAADDPAGNAALDVLDDWRPRVTVVRCLVPPHVAYERVPDATDADVHRALDEHVIATHRPGRWLLGGDHGGQLARAKASGAIVRGGGR